jgi:c-di-GMP-binding flagellar brake protein YcgR
MFQDTRPATLDTSGGEDPYAEFRVSHPHERVALLRQLRDGALPVILNGPDGSTLTTTLWSLDEHAGRLHFDAGNDVPALQRLLEADEGVAVAYMDSVKLQFELQNLMLLSGATSRTLQSELPRQVWRFQRRQAYRVRAPAAQAPVARLRHPAIPDMALTLRVLDLSIGGCALWFPRDLPPLTPGTRFNGVTIELDGSTRFSIDLQLQHVTAQGVSDKGHRLGCEWLSLPAPAERLLQRWIDQAQKRRRLLVN